MVRGHTERGITAWEGCSTSHCCARARCRPLPLSPLLLPVGHVRATTHVRSHFTHVRAVVWVCGLSCPPPFPSASSSPLPSSRPLPSPRQSVPAPGSFRPDADYGEFEQFQQFKALLKLTGPMHQQQQTSPIHTQPANLANSTYLQVSGQGVHTRTQRRSEGKGREGKGGGRREGTQAACESKCSGGDRRAGLWRSSLFGACSAAVDHSVYHSCCLRCVWRVSLVPYVLTMRVFVCVPVSLSLCVCVRVC
jgi:hypothetical protein